MDKQIIQFRADEQTLIKLTGEDLFASNIVSYIDAEFDLGTNWDDFDAIRAVWASNARTIAMVLDTEGKCSVPAEMMQFPSRVLVNLVGSKVVNGVLQDRLTSYPVLAFTIDKDARLIGTETPELTPNQFEQYAAYVREAYEGVVDSRKDAEAWAKGTRNGIVVAEDDETYQNNSKYYAEASHDYAGEAQGYAEAAHADMEYVEASVPNYVEQYITEHPEYVTTVVDGSLTEAKLSNALKQKTIKDYVTPEMFGAKGDGITDDREAILAAIDSGEDVLFSKTYNISSPITIDRDIHIMGKGTIISSSGAFILSPNRKYLIEGLTFSGSGSGTCIQAVRIHDESFITDVKIDNYATGIECIACWVSNYEGLLITSCGIGIDFNEGNNIVNLSNTAIFNCTTAINVYQGENYAGQTSGLTITGCTFEYDIKVIHLHTFSYGVISNLTFENNYVESCANCITSEADSTDGRLRSINIIRNNLYFSNQESYNDYYIDLSATRSIGGNIIGNLCKNNNIKLVKFKSDSYGYVIQGNDLQNVTFDALGSYGYVENSGALYAGFNINDKQLENVVLKSSNSIPSTQVNGKLVYANGKVYKGDGYQYGMLWSVEDIHNLSGSITGQTSLDAVTLKTRSNVMVNICLTNVTANTVIRIDYNRQGTTYTIREEIALDKNNISRSYFVNTNLIAITLNSNCNYNVNVFPVGD